MGNENAKCINNFKSKIDDKNVGGKPAFIKRLFQCVSSIIGVFCKHLIWVRAIIQMDNKIDTWEAATKPFAPHHQVLTLLTTIALNWLSRAMTKKHFVLLSLTIIVFVDSSASVGVLWEADVAPWALDGHQSNPAGSAQSQQQRAGQFDYSILLHYLCALGCADGHFGNLQNCFWDGKIWHFHRGVYFFLK